MKTLNIPKILGLETLSPEELVKTLEIHGAHDAIDNAPWTSFPYKPEVTISVATTDKYLFICFSTKGLGLKAEFATTNMPVWQDSCVEFFVEDKDGKGYRNFEINCIGTLLSAHQERKGINTEMISHSDADKIIRYPSVTKEPFTEIDGIHEWKLTVGIPWNFLGYETIPESIKANFYKCADGSKWPHYLCWSPIATQEPDFHRPEFFGKLIFLKS